MGFWRDVINAHERRQRRQYEREHPEGEPVLEDPTEGVKNAKGAWLFNLVTYIAVLGIFADVAILIVALMKIVPFTSDLLMWLSIIGILCFGSLQSLTWIKYLMNGQNRTISIVNLCFVGINVIMWIISVILGVKAYQMVRDGVENSSGLAASMNFIRAALFITIQLSIANSIMNTILRVKKRWIPFQIIMYVSLLYVDFYLSFVILCFNFTKNGFALSDKAGLLISPLMLTLLSIAVIYVLISRAIFNGGRRRRRRGIFARTGIADAIDEENDREEERRGVAALSDRVAAEAAAKTAAQETPQKKLAALKEMLDQGLITEEEFKAKKDEILKNM